MFQHGPFYCVRLGLAERLVDFDAGHVDRLTALVSLPRGTTQAEWPDLLQKPDIATKAWLLKRPKSVAGPNTTTLSFAWQYCWMATHTDHVVPLHRHVRCIEGAGRIRHKPPETRRLEVHIDPRHRQDHRKDLAALAAAPATDCCYAHGQNSSGASNRRSSRSTVGAAKTELSSTYHWGGGLMVIHLRLKRRHLSNKWVSLAQSRGVSRVATHAVQTTTYTWIRFPARRS